MIGADGENRTGAPFSPPGKHLAVGVVLLAAGASRRLGRPKQLLPYAGTTLLRHLAAEAVAGGTGPVVVVLGAEREACQRELDGLPVELVENPAWEEGMGSSIRAGISRLLGGHGDTSAAIIATCDQPLVSSDLLRRLATEHRLRGAAVVACEYAGNPGVPALFGRELFHELGALRGDRGARSVIERHRGETIMVAFEDGVLDVDTPEDAARLGALQATGRLRP
jgi:molybdenum cofactor cytidylyltransferase